ncbi:hypothetical protein W59_11421 [Rhodococcus opacus RKJ300 = JCM 13270]|uniref:Universal stress protein n=1 Tax=Rhodococcus opacus RKJ300 = JCM 13270 TaxID=1165867 RepID=I0WTT6_RHOOP|nr:hypothetical protein W59_11421 [Rhodococcus opacus RKJ300 = JCM 13270]
MDLRPEGGDLLPYGDDLLAATIEITDRRFRVPSLVEKGRNTMTADRPIVVGTDGSPSSLQAVSWLAGSLQGSTSQNLLHHALGPGHDLPPAG